VGWEQGVQNRWGRTGGRIFQNLIRVPVYMLGNQNSGTVPSISER
jgi:hypothetical protein